MNPRPGSSRWIAVFPLLLFVSALAVRVLFVKATPDGGWAYSAFYKGDAPVWLEYARALSTGAVFEWGLPLRPPGMAYLVDLFWNGETNGVGFLRFVWCVLGALVPVVFFFAARRVFGFLVAGLAGVCMAAATGLLFLSASLNNETPYLLLVGGSLWLLWRLDETPSVGWLLVWAVLQGLACLVRVEHLLFAMVCLGWFLVRRSTPEESFGMMRRIVLVGAAVVGFFLPLVPWHVSVWERIAAFHESPADLGEAREAAIRQIEGATAEVTWDGEALRLREELPGFARHFWSAVVAVSVASRGGDQVRANDLFVLRNAYGFYPERLRPRPLITLYGPLNFYLANNEMAGGGFGREILEQDPPYVDGKDAYHPFLTAGVPPTDDLALWYPPHLEAINHGYGMGLNWIKRNPRAFGSLAGKKLGRFWSGASLGYTGHGIPLGAGGHRAKVDLTVARTSPLVVVWRLAALGLVGAGLVVCVRNRAALPWVFFLAANVAVVVFFFGYARAGAMMLPVVLVLGTVPVVRYGLERVPRRPLTLEQSFLMCLVLLAVCVAAEAVRFSNPPEIYIRGRKAGDVDPYPEKLYVDQEINLR